MSFLFFLTANCKNKHTRWETKKARSLRQSNAKRSPQLSQRPRVNRIKASAVTLTRVQVWHLTGTGVTPHGYGCDTSQVRGFLCRLTRISVTSSRLSALLCSVGLRLARSIRSEKGISGFLFWGRTFQQKHWILMQSSGPQSHTPTAKILRVWMQRGFCYFST